MKQEPKNLFSDNASKGGSQQSSRQGCLKETSNEKVHIRHCPGEQRVPRRKVKILDLEKIRRYRSTPLVDFGEKLYICRVHHLVFTVYKLPMIAHYRKSIFITAG